MTSRAAKSNITTSMPRSAGARPVVPSSPTIGPLLLEHLSEQEGWAVLDENGHQLNPYLRTAAGLAYYLRREKLTARITNLDVLPLALQAIATRKAK